MNIERKARDAIEREVSNYLGVSIQFNPHRNDSVRAKLSRNGKEAAVYFHRMALTNTESSIRKVVSDTRFALREISAIKRGLKVNKVGSFGSALIEAATEKRDGEKQQNGHSHSNGNGHHVALPTETELLCPDAIASGAASSSAASAHKEEPTMQDTVSKPGADQPSVGLAALPILNGHKPPLSAAEVGKGKKLARTEIRDATRLLDRHGTWADGVYTYAEGWSDEKVRLEIGTEVRVNTIGELRRDGWGKIASEIKVPASPIDATALGARIHVLEQRLADMEKRLAAAEAVTRQLA